jgi:uncharacterized protein
VIDQLTARGGKKGAELVAEVLNTARDGIGMGVLHLAALNGNCTFHHIGLDRGLRLRYQGANGWEIDEVLDILLDQEGLEIEELDRMEKDTPLHKAVRYTNELDAKEWEAGKNIVDILLDAGCDPRFLFSHFLMGFTANVMIGFEIKQT